MTMNLEKHLMELSEAPGIAGYERPVRELIAQTWEPLADALRVDAMGSLIATLHGSGSEPRPRILITAHMDEIGLMVTQIEDGFIRVTNVGGIDQRVLLAQPVIVHGAEPLPGLIAARPPHVLPESQRKKYPGYDDLAVDVGLPSSKVAKLVRVGDPVTFDQQAVKLGDGWISGKAMDNRASVACMTRLLELLGERRPAWDVLVAATVQEEVGLKGGATVGYGSEADLAIVVDTTWGIGVGVGDDKGFKLGDGPTLGLSAEAHPKLFEWIQDAGKEHEIKLQTEVLPGASGTEAQELRLSREGIPTAILSIPIRNMHTPVEVVSLRDIQRAARLIAAFVTTLDGETLSKLTWDDDPEG